MELVKNYKKALQEIYNHVGFVEDWVIYPIDDNTEYYWEIDGNEVVYAQSVEELETQEGECYSGSVYEQRFYDKHIYEGEKLTLIFLDTQTDGMKYFALFSNEKRQS